MSLVTINGPITLTGQIDSEDANLEGDIDLTICVDSSGGLSFSGVVDLTSVEESVPPVDFELTTGFVNNYVRGYGSEFGGVDSDNINGKQLQGLYTTTADGKIRFQLNEPNVPQDFFDNLQITGTFSNQTTSKSLSTSNASYSVLSVGVTRWEWPADDGYFVPSNVYNCTVNF